MQSERIANQENPRKRITIALQGGGSHGAFTWGVLDRLLKEPALDIETISGTSAGAMNGGALSAWSYSPARNLSWASLWGRLPSRVRTRTRAACRPPRP
jgi:predicted acylesterase/phospholipase RssA